MNEQMARELLLASAAAHKSAAENSKEPMLRELLHSDEVNELFLATAASLKLQVLTGKSVAPRLLTSSLECKRIRDEYPLLKGEKDKDRCLIIQARAVNRMRVLRYTLELRVERRAAKASKDKLERLVMIDEFIKTLR